MLWELIKYEYSWEMKEGVVVKCLQSWEAVLMKENIQMLKRDKQEFATNCFAHYGSH